MLFKAVIGVNASVFYGPGCILGLRIGPVECRNSMISRDGYLTRVIECNVIYQQSVLTKRLFSTCLRELGYPP